MHNPLTTQRLMQYVFIALLPTAAWGVYAFGFSALLVLALSRSSPSRKCASMIFPRWSRA